MFTGSEALRDATDGLVVCEVSLRPANDQMEKIMWIAKIENTLSH